VSPAAGHGRLAGLLLVWACLPLPFTQIVMLPFWLTAATVAAVRAARPERGLRPPGWILNVVAVVIVGLVLAAGGYAVGPLRPLGHLLLLLSAVQVATVRDRPSLLRALPGVALVWLVSVSASTHLAVAPYFAASAVVAWWAGMRIHLDGLAEEARLPPPGGPSLGHAAAGAVAAMVLAVPVFVAMPRLASPWVSGYGAHAVTGFSSTVDLGGTGTIQESREVAVVVTLPAATEPPPGWTRLRGTVLDPVARGSWAPRRVEFDEVLPAGRRAALVAGADLSGAERLEIEVHRPERYLFVPEGTVAIEPPVPVTVDEAGSVVLARRPDGPLRYSVWARPGPVPRFESPVDRELRFDDPDPRVAAMADEVAGDVGDPAGRAAAVERFLKSRFDYSLTRGGGYRRDPVTWFLLEGRRGHCEYFAASMVVLLRHLEVPARIVSGYSGGEVAPGGREILIREANAHTWVEAWAGPRRGWMAFDPTPTEGVPQISRRSGIQRLLWVWDWITLAWDRYVLTFGIGEQVGLLAAAIDGAARASTLVRWWHLLLVAALAAGVAAAWRRRRLRRGPARPRGPAAAAVERLAGRLARAGVEVPRGATVRWIGRAAARRWPDAEAPVGHLVGLAEHELYARGPSPVRSGADARRTWASIRRVAAG